MREIEERGGGGGEDKQGIMQQKIKHIHSIIFYTNKKYRFSKFYS